MVWNGKNQMFRDQSKLYKSFKKDYRTSNLPLARKLALFAASFYMFFSVLDIILLNSSMNQLVKVRAITTIILFFIISLTYLNTFKKHWQKLFCLFVIVAGIGIIIMSSYLECPLKTLYSQGLLLVIFYGYTMNRLLLIPATIAGISVTIIYSIILFNTPEIGPLTTMTSLSFQVAANIFGIFNIAYKQRILFKEYVLEQKDINQSKKMSSLNKKLITLNKKLNDLASTDGLTGIANRRHFDETLNQFIHNSQLEKTPLTLIMLDIDYFKLYNDFYGHVKGDECLKSIAQILQHSTQGSNGLVARFGGEEFTIILPNTDYKKAIITVKAIISTLKVKRIQHNDSPISPFVTASYGVVTACIEYHSLTAKKLVTYADTCLYEAKENGRDKYIGISI